MSILDSKTTEETFGQKQRKKEKQKFLHSVRASDQVQRATGIESYVV